MKITVYSVRRRLATSAIVLALAVLGLYGLWRLPVNFLPDMTYPMVKLNIYWSGATPEEIERGLADPIERQMMTVDGLDYLESSSIEGMYSLIANFRYGVNINVAYQDATAALARVARKLPKDIDPPVIFKADPSQIPILQLTVRSDRLDLVKLRTWTDEWLQDQILSVPGVAGTEIVGGLQREIRVHLKPDALEKYGLTISGVLKRLREENVQQFGGRVTVGPQEIIARTMGEYASLDDIRNIVLLRDGAAKVFLRDVAEVVDSHREARVITRLDRQPAVKLSVLKQADANTVEVSRAVEKRLAELKSGLPQGIALGMVENQGTYVVDALKGVKTAAAEAAILVVLIVWLFLGSWRQVVVIAVALPLILIMNFGLMQMAGFSLNIFSLGGLVIAIGVLVDNSILVIEAISRQRDEHPEQPINELVTTATADIGPAVVASTLAFLALFVPFLLVPGLVSLLFRELILVIAGIVLISLATAVTLTPMLTAALLGSAVKIQAKGRFEAFFDRITQAYGRWLAWMLDYRYPVLAVFIVTAVAGGFATVKLGSEFLPQMDDGRILVKVKLPTGASLAETDRVLRDIEQRIGGDKRIESLFAMAGGKAVGTVTFEIANEGEINVQLLPGEARTISTQQYIAELRPIVVKVPAPGGKVTVSQTKVKGMRKLGDADIEVKIKGADMARLFDMARHVSQTMNELKHFTNVYVAMDLSKPEYQVKVDRARAAEMGVSVADVADTLRTLVSGTVATRLREGNYDYDIRVMVPESRVSNRSDLENLRITTVQGGSVRLIDLAQVRLASGPVEIVRENQVKMVIVRGDASGVSVGEALGELQTAMAKETVPPGYQLSYGGQAQMMSEMTRSVLLILVFAVFFSFIVLAVQFNSVKLPALILGSVPFCLAGSAGLLLFTGKPLGATVIIGVLVVLAAVVNAGVLLFTYARVLEEENQLPVRDAVLKAAKLRLRPRIMVTTAILIGLVPLALALEAGGDMLQPMAIAAIGGLLMENFVSLFLMPVLYLMANRETGNPALKGEQHA
ncbi:RND transporter, HAE1/HME family, permease protein (plasmid) [Sulfuricella denitrificans skB26]|uniref:RND transporter, HAE1/HME family, permease protein n=1 Tax=Sulfuricella denitrificans (strain DSM 22764 / NBRC 105220 / skB26) TaxID=1163617 RepID=S6APL5_SULDS|nr:efflux RND transporter permease subunit [Sulfuricella denitrificans]BAN36879.1 RND transporter, HAE1/HME family, permease protein [Sulfuricella denitrificans skB26]